MNKTAFYGPHHPCLSHCLLDIYSYMERSTSRAQTPPSNLTTRQHHPTHPPHPVSNSTHKRLLQPCTFYVASTRPPDPPIRATPCYHHRSAKSRHLEPRARGRTATTACRAGRAPHIAFSSSAVSSRVRGVDTRGSCGKRHSRAGRKLCAGGDGGAGVVDGEEGDDAVCLVLRLQGARLSFLLTPQRRCSCAVWEGTVCA